MAKYIPCCAGSLSLRGCTMSANAKALPPTRCLQKKACKKASPNALALATHPGMLYYLYVYRRKKIFGHCKSRTIATGFQFLILQKLQQESNQSNYSILISCTALPIILTDSSSALSMLNELYLFAGTSQSLPSICLTQRRNILL